MTDEEFQLPKPQSIEAEQSVLGACLIDAAAVETAVELLVPNDFHELKHNVIFTQIVKLREDGVDIDIVTVTAALHEAKKFEKAGGTQYLAWLAGSVPTASNVDHYAEIVREKSQLRKLLSASEEIASGVHAGTGLVDIIEDTQKVLRALEGGQKQSFFVQTKEIVLTAFEEIELRYSNRTENGDRPLTGIPSGYPDLDKMTAGFQRSDLIILAARPAVGKTAFALNVAQNVAVRAGENVAIFSLEMSKEQLVQRMLCAEGNIDATKVRSGNLDENDWPKLAIACGTIGEAPIFIDDTPGTTVMDIRAKCRKLHEQQGGLGLIVIDYLQLITGGGRGSNRVQEISEITRQLKLLARELHVPVIALSQLSRSVEQRQNKRPMMSDLRESGSIEQDADIVTFLYRDEYYNPETEKKNVVELNIAKQRSGPNGTVELVFLKNFNKFVSLERQPEQYAIPF